MQTDSQQFAKSSSQFLRISPRKLGLVAQSIRGLSVEEALVQLTFSTKRISREVKKCLQSAIANADNNHSMQVEKLMVSSVLVGKSLSMKRFVARARGRGAMIKKTFSKLTIILSERGE